MALACTKVEAFVREIDEPITKRFQQVIAISLTGANTDATHDLGAYVAGSLGTLWTAVGADGAAGQAALGLLQSVSPSIGAYLGVGSPEIRKRSLVGAGQVLTFLSAASAGGAATETYTVTGLLATDVVLAVTPAVAVTNAVYAKAYGVAAANALPVTYSADPGAGGKVKVTVYRPTGVQVPSQGQVCEAVANNCSNLSYASGDAPTAVTYYLTFDLVNGSHGVKYPSP